MSLRFLVTRALPEAEATAARLRAMGGEAFIEPMLHIEFATDVNADVRGACALIFTSIYGVRAFAQASDEREIVAYCVGDSTREAARAAGFLHTHSADGDGKALGELITRDLRPDQGRLVHIAGEDFAADISSALAARGFDAERRTFYKAHARQALSGDLLARLSSLDRIIFHSPRGAHIFTNLLMKADPRASAALDAVALSPAVAEAALISPWRRLIVAASPREDALLAAAFAQ